MKGELEEDPNNPQQRKNRSRFLEQTGARYVRLIREGLPINPLYRYPERARNAQVAYEIASLIRCFTHQLGAIQERNICDAYQRLAAPSFPALATELEKQRSARCRLVYCAKDRKTQFIFQRRYRYASRELAKQLNSNRLQGIWN